MIVRELISDILPSVKSTDLATRALDWMNEFKLSQLPVLDEGNFVGMISENEILDAAEPASIVGDLTFAGLSSAFIYQEQHVYDALEVMTSFKLEVLPVLDEENKYLGVITLRDLLTYLSKLFAIREPGGILVLEIPHNGYVLSEIGRIVESEDAKVMSLYLSPIPHTQDLLITLKLNVEDLSRVVASFERFEYKVVRVYHQGERADDYRKNLEALIKYLDM